MTSLASPIILVRYSSGGNRLSSHLCFSVRRSSLQGTILIPKYYDPELADALDVAQHEFDLIPLRQLLHPDSNGSRLGDWVRREYYGTGDIPYVRTSDLVGWRIRPDFKKGVSDAVYQRLRAKQDIEPGDVLMVAHGTYLVGTVAIVTDHDARLVLQDHVFRLRPSSAHGITGKYLLAALSTAFVKRQVRSKQFSADIIDKIGDRHLDILVPVPKDRSRIPTIEIQVEAVISSGTRFRETATKLIGAQLRMLRERSDARHGYFVSRSSLRNRILLPKYYDPDLETALRAEEADWGEQWPSLGDLCDMGLLSAQTGVEVGKLAYGTGTIPFIRTSDIADWEVRLDTKQCISQEFFDQCAHKASVDKGDILIVRDGTYLVGSSALVSSDDVPALICGGIYRLRCLNPVALSPETLFALLNLPLTRRQMRARQFTRDVIDTLGKRLLEVKIPPPTSKKAITLGKEVSTIFVLKEHAKKSMANIVQSLEPPIPQKSANRPGWSMR